MTKQILVTGATGTVGGLVVERLIASGRRPRALVRDEAKARARFGDGAELFVGDLGAAPSLARAMLNVDAVLAVGVGSAIESHDAAIADYLRAARRGRIVKLSSLDARRGSDADGVGAWHARSEASIRAKGVPFTFVQPTGFMSNVLPWAHAINTTGCVRASTGDGRVAMVDPVDIADVCIAALTRADLEGETLAVTGPEALSYAEMVAVLARVLERPVRFESISDDEAARMLAAMGRPADVVAAVTSLWRAIRQGETRYEIADTVPRILGRRARTFEVWAREHASAFVEPARSEPRL